MKRRVYVIAAVVLVILVGTCLYYYNEMLKKNDLNVISADEYETDFSDLDVDDDTVNDFDDNLLRVVDWDNLRSFNEDAKYWLYIPDAIDDCVYESVDGFYKNHNAYGEASKSGVLNIAPPNKDGISDARILIEGIPYSVLAPYEKKDYANDHGLIYVYTDDFAQAYAVYSVFSDSKKSDVYAPILEYFSDSYQALWDKWNTTNKYVGMYNLLNYDSTASILVLSSCPKGYSNDERFYMVCMPYRRFDYTNNCVIDASGRILDVLTEDERWEDAGILNNGSNGNNEE